MALQWIVNLIQFVSWLPWAVSMNTIFKLWLTNIRSIKNMKVVTSHPQNSLAGESLGVLGHCRLLILLNWLDTKVSTLWHEDVQDQVINFHLFTILNTRKHTLTQTVEADEDALTPWLFACPLSQSLPAINSGRPKGTLTHLNCFCS